MRPISVLLPGSRIPLGSTVIKNSGTKKYILRDQLRLFSEVEGCQSQSISAVHGVRFLVGGDGNAEAISADVLLRWSTTENALFSFLSRERMEDK